MLPTPDLLVWKARRVVRRLSRAWTPVTWYPLWRKDSYAAYDIAPDWEQQGTPLGLEPHDATGRGIATCPVCWDSVALRPNNPNCPTCFGSGFLGGFNMPTGIRMYITEYDFSLSPYLQEERVGQPRMMAQFLASYLVLPDDMVIVNKTGLRFRAGLTVQNAGLQSPIVTRMVIIYPMNVTDEARTIPFTPLWGA